MIDIDTHQKQVICKDFSVHYDYLVIATGATHTYFNHDEWSRFAPGIKSIDDALHVRKKSCVHLNGLKLASILRSERNI